MVVALPGDKTILKRDFPFSIGVTLLLLGMCAFDLKVSRGEGMVLFGIFLFTKVNSRVCLYRKQAGSWPSTPFCVPHIDCKS